MFSVKGIYENGIVKFEDPLGINKTSNVIVTFLEDDRKAEPRRLTKEDFSFSRSRESSKRYRGNLSEAVIEERASER